MKCADHPFIDDCTEPVCIAVFQAHELREENERLRSSYEYLATEMIYEGNSTRHWWAKAHAYSGIVGAVCNAFRDLGYKGEMGDLPTLPKRLNEFVQELKSTD